jgi:hypothetical protein
MKLAHVTSSLAAHVVIFAVVAVVAIVVQIVMNN